MWVLCVRGWVQPALPSTLGSAPTPSAIQVHNPDTLPDTWTSWQPAALNPNPECMHLPKPCVRVQTLNPVLR